MFGGFLKKILHQDDLNFWPHQFYDYVSIITIQKYLVESIFLTHIILHFKKV